MISLLENPDDMPNDDFQALAPEDKEYVVNLIRRLSLKSKQSDPDFKKIKNRSDLTYRFPFDRRPDLFPKNDVRLALFMLELSEKAVFSADLNIIADDLDLSLGRIRSLCLKNGLPSPAQLKRIIAVEKAKVLLENSYMSLYDCSVECGFKSQANFSAIFSAETGIPPLKYRRMKTISNEKQNPNI